MPYFFVSLVPYHKLQTIFLSGGAMLRIWVVQKEAQDFLTDGKKYIEVDSVLEKIREREGREKIKTFSIKALNLLSFFPYQPPDACSIPVVARVYPEFCLLSFGRCASSWLPEIILMPWEVMEMAEEEIINKVFNNFLLE